MVDSERTREGQDLNLRSSEPLTGANALEIVHVIDSLGPGGAQHILHALTRDNPTALVCALHVTGETTEVVRQFPGANLLARSKYALLRILFNLIRVVWRYRTRVFFNAHLEMSTLFLCLMRRVFDFRLVVTLHATQAQWSSWFRIVFRRVIFYADHVIVESHRMYKETRALGIPEDRLTLIPIGTTRSATECRDVTSNIREELGIAAGTPIFLNIARMVPGKGQIHLVRAMALVPDAIAVIVGYGPEESRLRGEVRRLALHERVRFAGRRTDLHNFYSVARAFVMPCLDESMGIVIYDALTNRLPVVAYASGSIGEIISDGENGYLLAHDVESLAAALNKVLRNETAFQFLPPQTYSAATMVNRHESLYLELARKWLDPAKGLPDA